METKRLIALAALALAVPLGFSQGTNSGSGSTTSTDGNNTANGTGTAASAATVNNSYSSTSNAKNFVEAAPGNIPAIFPGMPQKGQCFLYDTSAFDATPEAVKVAAKGFKIPRGIHAVPLDPNAKNAAPYDGAIGFTRYNTRSRPLPGDKFLAVVMIPGKYLHPDEQTIAKAIEMLRKEAPGMERATAVGCGFDKTVTKALTWGLGASGADTPGTGNHGVGMAVGVAGGRSQTDVEESNTLYVYALGHGPLDIPPAVIKVSGDCSPHTITTAPSSASQCTGTVVYSDGSHDSAVTYTTNVGTITSLGMFTSTTTGTATVTFTAIKDITKSATAQVAITAPAPREISPAPAAAEVAPAPPAPVAPPPPPVDECATLPAAPILFDFNKAVVKPKYQSVAESVADWMESHPSCNVSVEGYASVEGSNTYNDHLGEERAKAVYDILTKHKDLVDRLPVYLSGGKRFVIHHVPHSEHNQEDRKVVFAIRNITSGK